jgi:hypothetical protein
VAAGDGDAVGRDPGELFARDMIGPNAPSSATSRGRNSRRSSSAAVLASKVFSSRVAGRAGSGEHVAARRDACGALGDLGDVAELARLTELARADPARIRVGDRDQPIRDRLGREALLDLRRDALAAIG